MRPRGLLLTSLTRAVPSSWRVCFVVAGLLLVVEVPLRGNDMGCVDGFLVVGGGLCAMWARREEEEGSLNEEGFS